MSGPTTGATNGASGSDGVRPYVALALAGTCWGTGFLFGKLALEELSVDHMLLYRFLIGSLAFVPFAHRAGTRIASWNPAAPQLFGSLRSKTRRTWGKC